MSDPVEDQARSASWRVPQPTFVGWLGILVLMALVFVGALMTGRLLGRALHHLLN